MSDLLPAGVAGIVAGLGIAVPLGPIGILILDLALRRGFRIGAAAGLGAASVDGFYALVAVLAGGPVVAALSEGTVPLRVVAGLLLVAIALRGIRSARRRVAAPAPALSVTSDPRSNGPSPRRTYLTLVGLTLVNPLTIVYFAALVVGLPSASGSLAVRLAFAAGAAAASATWQLLLVAAAARIGERLPERGRLAFGLVGHAIILILALSIVRSAVGA